MSLQNSRRAGIHRTALGGFTIDGPYFRRQTRASVLLGRFFHWLGGLTMAHGYRPGSKREPAHGSHQPAAVPPTGQRSPQSDALAYAALENARAMLATHRSRIKTPRWW
ncbi:hypothetical protein OJJOAM_000229 [Cupriavidus sp. H18C1]|uniref:hypothetical protein n=1 Tax=Cupriavidus sp. H18C1 TaxID=3241601 RepID=UPI003BB97AAA